MFISKSAGVLVSFRYFLQIFDSFFFFFENL